jgi:transposase-like protein
MATPAPSENPNTSNGNGKTPRKRHGRILRTLTEADWAEAEAMAGAGVSLARICAAMNLSETTLRKWRKLRTSLDDAFKKGFAKTEAEIGQTIVERAKKGDLAACIWWEKTRAGRREMRDVASGGKPVTSIVYQIRSAGGTLLYEVEPPLERPEPRQLGAG